MSKLRKTILKTAAATALSLGLTGAAQALQPSPGLWWQAGANGKFMQLQIGPGGYALVTLSFEEAGAPTYRVMQGQLGEITGPDAVAELSSPLYRIDRAGCLECAPQDAMTVAEEGRPYRLRFISTNRAQLQTGDGELIDYEFFPLYTDRQDFTALRVSGKRAVLENQGTSVLVELQPSSSDADCGVQFSPDEQTYKVAVAAGQPDALELGQILNNVDLVIDQVHNPRSRLLSRIDEYEFRCIHVALGGCINYAITLTGSRCVVAAEMFESGPRFIGKAEQLSYNVDLLPDPNLLPPLNFSGEIRLTVLD